jgi:TBC1 domain family member 10
MRGKAWFLLSGASKKLEKGKFDELLSIDQHPQIFEIIERDIHRCFPSTYPLFNLDHVMFAEKDGPGQKSLRQVLRAYALYNPVLGYCQGMGMIVGLFLMRMNPEVIILFNFRMPFGL